MSKKIRDSLDIFHNTVNETIVTIVKLEELGISLFELSLGIGLTVMGVMTYYLAPAAFLFNKLEIFFFIINLILIFMIIGLVFMCFLLFKYIQTAIIHIICFIVKFDRKLKPLILKNMNHSHNKRNTKTSVLMTISLAYLIFGGSSLLLIGDVTLKTVKNFVGTDILATSTLSEDDLPEKELRDLLNSQKFREHPTVYDYSFRGTRFYRFMEKNLNSWGSQTLFSGTTSVECDVDMAPLEINYLNSTLNEFYIPMYEQEGVEYEEIDDKPDLIWSLYSSQGTTPFSGGFDKFKIISRNATKNKYFEEDFENYDENESFQILTILPEGIRTVLSLNGGDTIQYRLRSHHARKDSKWRLLIRGLPRKVPGLPFLSYKQVQYFLHGMISFDDTKRLFKYLALNSENTELFAHYKKYEHEFEPSSNETYFYPKVRVHVKLTDHVSTDDREFLV